MGVATPGDSSRTGMPIAVACTIAGFLISPFWFPFTAISTLVRGRRYGNKGAGFLTFCIASLMTIVWFFLLRDARTVAVPVLILLALVFAIGSVSLSRMK